MQNHLESNDAAENVLFAPDWKLSGVDVQVRAHPHVEPQLCLVLIDVDPEACQMLTEHAGCRIARLMASVRSSRSWLN